MSVLNTGNCEPSLGARRDALGARARLEARALQRQLPDLFLRSPIRPSLVAKRLGIAVHVDEALQTLAVLSVESHEGEDNFTINLRAGLSQAIGRLIVAHEIGHVVFRRRLRSECNVWSRPEAELFANVFARTLLLPMSVYDQVMQSFRAATEPRAVLDLAARIGISPATLLTIARHEPGWLNDSSVIWLRVKQLPNRHTGRDVDLRITGACFDRNRFFIPENQRLKSISGDTSWLAALGDGDVARHADETNVSLYRRSSNPPSRWSKISLPGVLAAVRVSGSDGDPRPVFIVSIALTSLPSSTGRPQDDQ